MLLIRTLFMLAVLSNIGMFIYNRQHKPKQHNFYAVDKGIAKLVLLNELDEENTIWEDTQDQTEQEIFNQECYSVGAFDSKSEIRPIVEEIKPHVIKLRTRKITSTQEAGYWVFIPKLKTRVAALDISRKLTQFQIKDHYVVTGGENENSVSLGLYRDEQNANARLQELIAKGFNAEKQVRVEQWPEFWLDYAIASDAKDKLPNINKNNPEIISNKVECSW